MKTYSLLLRFLFHHKNWWSNKLLDRSKTTFRVSSEEKYMNNIIWKKSIFSSFDDMKGNVMWLQNLIISLTERISLQFTDMISRTGSELRIKTSNRDSIRILIGLLRQRTFRRNRFLSFQKSWIVSHEVIEKFRHVICRFFELSKRFCLHHPFPKANISNSR